MSSVAVAEKPIAGQQSREGRPAVPVSTIALAPPPKIDAQAPGMTSWLQYLFPVLGSMGGMLFIAQNPRPLFVASGLLFMLGSVGMGVGMAVQQRTGARRRIRAARTQYLAYLEGLREQARQTARAQQAVSTWTHPAPQALLSIAMSRRLWERRPEDPDFLRVRVGDGPQPVALRLTMPVADGAGPAVDPVCAAAIEDLLAATGSVDAALTVDLNSTPSVSLHGPRPMALDLARAMLCQIAVMHSPGDVHMRVSSRSTSTLGADWDWMKWLPHLRADGPAARTITVTDAGEIVIGWGDPDAATRIEVVRASDRLGPHAAEAIARALAPRRPSDGAATTSATGDVSLTSLLGIRDLAAFDAREVWRGRSLEDTLRTPIGISSEGTAVRLDFKEAALGGDGPHGILIGATGSGKSELLRTIVTGLALTHPPDRLAFVLADFKGGAAFAGMQALPHVAGLITNLADDLALVDRMHAALFGEIRRRQELLRAAGNLPTVREYHRKLDAGESLAPLPYLLLIVDEFGELLTARPDFIDLFVAVGRLGRSLGMHLLLASQQLDEGRLRGLEGHISYRIALRTFSASESRVVLGVPDAYELPPIPGSGYLKVGTTVYTRFRAAVVSLPYAASTATAVPLARARPFYLEAPLTQSSTTPPSHDDPTTLDVAVRRLRDAAPRVHQVWLPPLEPRVSLDAVLGDESSRRPMVVPVGLVDRPAEQARGLLEVDLSGSAGHLMVVGAALTGKTTFLRTLISSFGLTHTPLEAQFYCIDFGGGGLAALARLPHVGGVAGRQDPERVRRTVAEVASLLDERESRFASAGIDSPAALRVWRSRRGLQGAEWADVFLVVDNWPALRQEFEELEGPVQEIAARGLGYGVHVALTASRWIDVRSALRESIGGRLELRLHDPSESAINRREAENVARGVPGRGITSEALHFQAALPRIDGSLEVLDQQAALESLVEKVVADWDGDEPKPVLVLPRRVEAAGLDAGDAPGVVIGVAEKDLAPVRLDLTAGDPHFLVFGDGESGKTNVLRTFARGLMAKSPASDVQVLVVDYRRTLLGVVPPEYLIGYAGAEPAATAQLEETAAALTKRLPPADLSIAQLRARNWWKGPDLYVVVDDYDLVVTPGGNPLLPLLPLLAQARDIGLHVVIARRTGGAGRGVLEQLLLRLRELGSAGLLLSGDPQEGPLIGAYRATTQPPGRGLLVRRHEKPSLIQVALSDEPA